LIKKVILNCSIGILSLIASWSLYSFVYGEIFRKYVMPSFLSNISMTIFVAFSIYFISISVIEKRIEKIYIDILVVMWLCLIIELSIFRENIIRSGFNFNPLTIFNGFIRNFNHAAFIFIGNWGVYFPIGVYTKYKFKMSSGKLVGIFTIYIVLIEICQIAFSRGIFDIDDVIINILGFFIGVKFLSIINRFRLKHLQAIQMLI